MKGEIRGKSGSTILHSVNISFFSPFSSLSCQLSWSYKLTLRHMKCYFTRFNAWIEWIIWSDNRTCEVIWSSSLSHQLFLTAQTCPMYFHIMDGKVLFSCHYVFVHHKSLLCVFLLFFVTLRGATLITSSNGAQSQRKRETDDHPLLSPLGLNVSAWHTVAHCYPFCIHRNVSKFCLISPSSHTNT